MQRLAKLLLALSALSLLAACSGIKPLKGGSAKTKIDGAETAIVGPENPLGPTKSVTKSTTSRTYGKAPMVGRNAAVTAPAKEPTEPLPEDLVPEVVLNEVITKEVSVEVGAAQFDMSREISAKLESFKTTQLIGVGVLLFAAALFHPKIRLLTGISRDFQMAIAAVGLVLIYGPALLVGNEWVLAVILAGLYVYNRASYKNGQLDTLTKSQNDQPHKSGSGVP